MAYVLSAQWTAVVTSTTGDLVWTRDVTAKLDAIAALPHNWDGDGGDPVPHRIVTAAGELLLPLARMQPPVPRIAPVLGGGLQFEWHIGDRELEIEIMPDGTIEYLTAEGGRVQENGLPQFSTGEVKTLVAWVMGWR